MIGSGTTWVNARNQELQQPICTRSFAVANIVGGTIVIPHTRRAAEYWEELGNNE